MNLMSSTLLTEDTGVPFHRLQAEQIERFRTAWQAAGRARAAGLGQPQRVPGRHRRGSRLLRRRVRSRDQVGQLEGGTARFGKTYAGEPDQAGQGPRRGRGDRGRGHLLLTIPNQLGVEYNRHLLDSVLRHVAPGLGWR